MAELIDYLFFFWFGLTVAVYVLVNLYESQQKASRDAKEAQERRRRSLDTAQWTPYTAQLDQHHLQSSSSQFDYNSNNYNTNLDYNYSSQPQHGGSSSSSYYAYQQPTAELSAGSPAYLADSSALGNLQQQPSYSLSSSSNANNHWRAQEQSPYNGLSSEQQQQQDSYSMSARSYGHPHYDFSPTSNLAQQRHRLQLGADNSIPTATGFSSDCVEWVNEILYLFFSQAQKYGPIIGESVYRSLNEKLSNITSTLPEYNDLVVEFSGINMDFSSRPVLTNVRTETESDKSVSAICKIYNKQILFNLIIRKASLSRQTTAHNHAHSGYNDVSVISSPADDDIEAHYELLLENLEGKLKSMAMLSAKLIIIQFMEKPDTKILLRLKSRSNRMAPLNEDSLVQVILQSITQVVVDLYLGDDPDYPPFKPHGSQSSGGYRSKLSLLKGSASEIKRQIKHDFFGALSSSSAPASDSKERKIFIKILKAKNINYNQNVTCLLELDSPKQQAMSSTKPANSNPYWDEHFLFNVDDKSSELVLELWDSISVPQEGNSLKRGSKLQQLKQQLVSQQQQPASGDGERKWIKSELTSGAKFLGLARVNIDELRKEFAGVQKLSLELESRPMSPTCAPSRSPDATILAAQDLMGSNSVGGELQLELMFLEHSTATSSDSSKFLHKSQSSSSLPGYQQHSGKHAEVVSVDRKLTPAGYVITTTTITRPVGDRKRPATVARSSSARNPSPISASTHTSNNNNNNNNDDDDDDENINEGATGSGGKDEQQAHRARSRSRSRSLLRAIKKRFSFSRTRSRSASESGAIGRLSDRHSSGGRLRAAGGAGSSLDPSAASDSRPGSPGTGVSPFNSRPTSRASSELSIDDGSSMGANRAKSVPASRDLSEVPTIVINKSRLSDTGSAFTFTHPKSQLVIECLEPCLSADGIGKTKSQVRHYAISEQMLQSKNNRRWRRLKGLKLHVFNEHQFVACHLAGSSTCHLCGKVFSRRPGKQGYKCRNCHLLSHKQCHVKVDHNCPYASVDGLKLEYIDADPPASLVAEQQHASAAAGASSPSNRPMRMGAKSISMEDR